MKKLWPRLCSLVLVTVLTIQSLPVSAFAIQTDSIPPASTEDFIELDEMEDLSKVETEEAKILEEYIEGRTEFSKQFLLDNGLSLAVLYDSAVHFEKNGQWEEIDNTLLAKSNGTYANKAGIWEVEFPQQLTQNNQIFITKDGYTLSFGMAGELRQQGNLEVMSTGNEKQQEEIEASSNAVAPEEMITDTVEDGTNKDSAIFEIISHEGTQHQSSSDSNNTSQEATVLELDTQLPTATVLVDGAAQTFAVASAQTANGQIQKIDREELFAAVEHPEAVLEKPFSQLMYENVYSNTDIRYDLVGNQVKESVILEAYSRTLRGYQFSLNTGALVPVLAEDGHIDFYDAQQKNIIMVMPAPYLVDEDNAFCNDVRVSLSGKDGVYTLTYLLPQQWLAASDRAWPVVLDPVVMADSTIWNVLDQTVMSAKEYDYQWGMLQVGQSATSGISRPYVGFANLPELHSSDVILDAQIGLCNPNTGTTPILTTVHKVNDTWDPATLQWDNMPSFQSSIEDYAIITGSGWYYWNVTDIVREWYAGENTGMMFKASDEDESVGPGHYKQFYSSNWGTPQYLPKLTIIYRNNNGIEGYWDYTTASAGRAGTAYVNQYTGNLTWVHSDLGFGGNRMPVSINHVYNANDVAVTHFGVGKGWRTNFNQLVYPWSVNTSYYVWEDADGTDHYFLYESSGTYKDEDGLELTLTTTGSGTKKYCIADKYGNKSYFDTVGRLTQQVNNQQTASSITIAYPENSSSYLIQSVTDGAGRKYNFTYNSSNLLSKITYVGSGSSEISSVSYGYSSSKLTSVTYKDGKSTAFAYGSNNLLTSATDVDGYALKFAYNTTTAGQPNRISKVSEFDGSVVGGVLNIEYAHNQTTLTDHNDNVQILQFNNMGNTVCIQDGEGHAQYAQYAKNNADETTKGNQLKASSKLQNTVNNLLADSSFEGGTSWSAASGTAAITGDSYMGNNSLLVTGGRVNSPTFSVASGESCTFSAYVKTTGNGASLALYSSSTAVASQAFAACSSWTRVEVSYTNTSSSTKTISAALLCASGQKVYMDCVQVEKSPTASRYNLVQNGDFNLSGSPAQNWTGTGLTSVDARATASDKAAPQLNTKAMKIVGSPTAVKKISQTVNISGSKNDAYVIAGWAKADSVPLDTTYVAREFGIRLVFNNTDGTSTEFVAQFNPDTNSTENWQYSAAAAVAPKAYSSITVEAVYAYNANTAYFDGIQLFKERFSTSYTYDENGNVTSVVDLQKKKTQYEYDNNDLTKEILPSGAELTYDYDDYHNVKTATTAEDLVYNFGYDVYGNNTTVSITNAGKTITTTATYNNNGNTLSKVTDAAGKETIYSYDKDTNVLNSLKLPKQETAQRTNYTYDEMYRMVSAAATTNTNLSLSANYTYTDDLLTKIQTGSTVYNFNYGNFGLRSNVKVGSRTLASYTYTSQNNYLDTLAYGNGDSVKYTYDNQGRVTKQTYEDGDTVTYRYDNDGALATVTDSDSGISTTYYYDFIDRMMKYVESGTNYSHSIGYTYDEKNNLSGITENINGTDYTTSYTYDDDNRVTQMSSGTTYLNYTYDGRGLLGGSTLQHQGTNVLTNEYSYREIDSDSITSQVKTQTMTIGGTETILEYSYDSHGNFSAVKKNTVRTGYVYDTADQLVRENNIAAGKAWFYTYDNAGNILSKAQYDYTNGTLGNLEHTITYTYGDSNWGDLLTQYDGNRITYDTIGNPLRGFGRNYTWEHGRELAELGVDSAFAITKQPVDFTGRVGDRVTFTIEAAGEGLTYQWQVSANNGRTWSNSTAGGYATASMWVTLSDSNSGKLYRCLVTDADGNMLASQPGKIIAVPVNITQQPVDFYGDVGDRVEFSITAEGTDLTYQWQVSANNGQTWGNSTAGGYATASMWVTLSTSNSGKQYRCKVTDGSGNVVYSEPGTIRTDPVAVTKHPEDCTAAYGARLSFTIEAYGENLTYQWQVSSNNGSTWSNTSAGGNKTASMWLNMTESYVGYLYRCKVTDGSGNIVYSDPAKAKAAQVNWKNTYNADGLRTQRTNGYTTYNYIYNGDKLSQMTVGEDVLRFGYSPSGVPLYVQWNDARYFYVTNIQGDVLAIISKSGNAVVEYTYDAWGNILTTTGSRADNLGKLNPLRYRGYVYDQEYGLYYLQSRYYDPEVGRFINADALASTGQGILGHNMFAYCGNNPVFRADTDGEAWNILIGAAVGAVVGGAGQLVSDLVTSMLCGQWQFSNWQTYAGAVVGGAAGGAILGGTGNVNLANAATGFFTTGFGYGLEKATGVSDMSWTEIAVSATLDGAIGLQLGKIPIKQGITHGRNSMSAVYKAGLTKLRNGTATTMSAKVIGKGLTSSFVGSLAMDGYYGVKQYTLTNSNGQYQYDRLSRSYIRC